ncbi:EipB family protein [Roseomonas marmotae]|uniref:Cell envelope integrity EipB family protein n=1 Tax=Roseomonas marmotae TaxID=2768161 RepID=A0ABS3KGP1_9PROT|nr:DUF1849 family protein [Roseomonas marmotae]MBO1076629.1 cell envelope integrity EipB family protein [Roseomonas marmotae]QTI79630.1 cell envelope integrity EipB family protein [Roseomonas marmotae]
MRLRDLLGTPWGSTALAATLALGLAAPAGAQAPAPAPTAAPAPNPLPGAAPQAQEGAEAMAAHRAAYRLSLARSRPGGQVGQAEGAMLFEVRDACDGWTTRQRLGINVVDRAGDTVETSSDYSTWESKDGRRLRFTLTQSAQGAVMKRITGEAELNGDQGGVVRYEQPEAQQLTLPPGTILPMTHTIRALAMAKAGQKMLNVPLFDGTTDEGAQDTTTLFSAWTPPEANPRFPLLADQGSARMRIAFFSRDASAGASTPEYEVGLRYFANGVADDMKMDFGDFVLDGKLEKLEPLPHDC